MRNFAFSSPGNYFDPYLTDDCTYNHHGDFGTTLIYNSSGQIPGETDKLWSIHRLLVPANGDSYFRLRCEHGFQLLMTPPPPPEE
ncbi:hypothetical protein H696_04059 [Fonticula alba]|uniref:Uncharacterized protein n=1 Tax=Fonticula alba TaxID=691883 RepID=A0A058Z6T2_FONAL|nr:hypothetical protein H696_04059 [Fonticula alba]KCV69643.1 hypothetical protein H696_04059 [Fonticula alba]|eukprot:XP_009496208.1 hypothetical protein H696_04059 [Fonticula alba]